MRGRRGYHAHPGTVSRRDLLRAAAALATTGCRPRDASSPAGALTRVEPMWGVQSGDVGKDSAVVWCRADRASTMEVEWSISPRFDRVTRVAGPRVDVDTDLVGKVRLVGLPGGARVHYRARFDGGPWATGSLGTPPVDGRDVLLAWSGDTNGQGWGIDPSRGGMPAYSAMLARAPELFIHCGDTVYADGPIEPEIKLADGGVWRNVVDPMKTKVAQSLAEFRGTHRYPRRCAEVRALSAAVPMVSIWDDHEIRNNWYPTQILDDDPLYDVEKRVSALMVHARRAFEEYAPALRDPFGPMYRVVPWGPLVDVFLLDGRTHKTPNDPPVAEGGLLGATQAAWLLDALSRSTAVWKVIACNMPIALVVSEKGKTVPETYDGWGNGAGPPREREVELARLLSQLRARGVKNLVWLTADVHYCAVHRFDPTKAVFKDFDAFHELVAGPMHATAFPQKRTDDTFGAEVLWTNAGEGIWGSPATGAQHFGLLRFDGKSRALTITFVDARGRDLHAFSLTPT